MPCDDDHQFQYPWQVKRHVREVHSRFGYKCPRPLCGRVLSRHMRHHPCEAQPRELFLYHRQTGARGEKAERMLKQWEEEELPKMWKEHFKNPFKSPEPVTPLPADPPARRPSPLERCHKRPFTPASYNGPPKRRKSNMCDLPEEELDLQHDPVPITLDLPSGIEIQPNPAHAGVSFEPPVKILPDPPTPMDTTDNVITFQIAEDLLLSDEDSSSNSSSSSTSSSSSSSSESDSDEEFSLSKFEPLKIVIENTNLNKDSTDNDQTTTKKTEKVTKDKRETCESKTKNKERKTEKTLTQVKSVKRRNNEKEVEEKTQENIGNNNVEDQLKSDRITERKTKAKEKTVENNEKSKSKEQDVEEKTKEDKDKNHGENKVQNTGSGEIVEERVKGKEKTSKYNVKHKSNEKKVGEKPKESSGKNNEKNQVQHSKGTGQGKAKEKTMKNKKGAEKSKVDKDMKVGQYKNVENQKKSEGKEKVVNKVNKESYVEGKKKDRETEQVISEDSRKVRFKDITDKHNKRVTPIKTRDIDNTTEPATISKQSVGKENEKKQVEKANQKEGENEESNEEKKEEQTETIKTTGTEIVIGENSEEQNKLTEINKTNTLSASTVEGFPFSETEETTHYHDDSQEFDLKDVDLNLENYKTFVQHLLFSDRDRTHCSTSTDAASADHPVDQQVVQKLEVELQETQEERIIFEVGNTQCHTSKVTARADPNSLFAMLFHKGCPFRPSTSNGRPTYFFDRDPAHSGLY